MNTFGEQLKLSIFGESHGNGIGVVIDGLPPGLAVDESFIESEMARRAPGNDRLSTPRKEPDHVEIVSGVFNGFTTGAPLCGMIRNTNTRSKDYTPELPRPGHADLTAHLKYNGYEDYRGGGHFSGRLTAPLVFAGALCKSLLKRNDILVSAKITEIAGVQGQGLTEAMEEAILHAKAEGDSVGGIIEACAENLPVGLGSPFFGSVESRLASMLYSIPAVKGVEFGDGFAWLRCAEALPTIPSSAAARTTEPAPTITAGSTVESPTAWIWSSAWPSSPRPPFPNRRRQSICSPVNPHSSRFTDATIPASFPGPSVSSRLLQPSF